MTAIKSFTDLQQSKKLAEILPIESADGFWEYHDKWCSEGDEWEGYEDYPRAEPYLEYTREKNEWEKDKSDVPCWSLENLLGFLPKEYTNSKNQVCSLYIDIEDSETPYLMWYVNPEHEGSIVEIKTEKYSNLIDACYEIVLKLNEVKMLCL